jgi:hypothetical protein
MPFMYVRIRGLYMNKGEGIIMIGALGEIL